MHACYIASIPPAHFVLSPIVAVCNVPRHPCPYATPTADVTITCPMELSNTGQLTLTSIKAVTNGTLHTDCGTVTSLPPYELQSCNLTAVATQDDFDAGRLTVAVSGEAGHLGFAGRTLGGTLSYSSIITLNSSASMDLVVAGSGTIAATGGDAFQAGRLRVWILVAFHISTAKHQGLHA